MFKFKVNIWIITIYNAIFIIINYNQQIHLKNRPADVEFTPTCSDMWSNTSDSVRTDKYTGKIQYDGIKAPDSNVREPIMVEGSNIRLYAHTAEGIPPSSRQSVPLTDWWPHLYGSHHKTVILSCVSRLVQLNKCVVVCDFDLKGGIVVMTVFIRLW